MTEHLSVQKLERRLAIPSRDRRRIYYYRLRASAIPCIVDQYSASTEFPYEIYGDDHVRP
jgi:hypothetical protein